MQPRVSAIRFASRGATIPNLGCYTHSLSRSNSKDVLTIDVKDFGPIRKASVDLRPLTVFVGQSNTGKSYLATLIYALHNLFGGHARRRVVDGMPDPIPIVRDPPRKVSKDDMQELLKWGTHLPSDWHKGNQALPEYLARIIRPKLKISAHFGPHIANELLRCLGLKNSHNLVRFGSNKEAAITIGCSMFDDTDSADRIKYSLLLSANDARIRNSIPPGIKLRINRKNYPSYRGEIVRLKRLFDDPVEPRRISQDLHYAGWIIDRITECIFSSIVYPLSNNSYYLPADRAGVMHAYKAVAKTLIGSVATAGLCPTVAIPKLSGILTDFLQELISFEGDSKGKNVVGFELGKQIEKRVLQGSVMVAHNETGYPSFLYRPNGWKSDLPLMSSSSMVSELAPVILYLRQIIRNGDVLIIEEPESHLHPEIQAQFASEIARMIRAGIRIIITTHSDLILEQIGNLIRISGLPKESQENLTDPDSVLSPDKVGVWVFTHEQDGLGSAVDEAELDSETGLFRVGYSCVRETLYNQGATAFNLLQKFK